MALSQRRECKASVIGEECKVRFTVDVHNSGQITLGLYSSGEIASADECRLTLVQEFGTVFFYCTQAADALACASCKMQARDFSILHYTINTVLYCTNSKIDFGLNPPIEKVHHSLTPRNTLLI